MPSALTRRRALRHPIGAERTALRRCSRIRRGLEQPAVRERLRTPGALMLVGYSRMQGTTP
jgi:hypothetical protein